MRLQNSIVVLSLCSGALSAPVKNAAAGELEGNASAAEQLEEKMAKRAPQLSPGAVVSGTVTPIAPLAFQPAVVPRSIVTEPVVPVVGIAQTPNRPLLVARDMNKRAPQFGFGGAPAAAAAAGAGGAPFGAPAAAAGAGSSPLGATAAASAGSVPGAPFTGAPFTGAPLGAPLAGAQPVGAAASAPFPAVPGQPIAAAAAVRNVVERQGLSKRDNAAKASKSTFPPTIIGGQPVAAGLVQPVLQPLGAGVAQPLAVPVAAPAVNQPIAVPVAQTGVLGAAQPFI